MNPPVILFLSLPYSFHSLKLNGPLNHDGFGLSPLQSLLSPTEAPWTLYLINGGTTNNTQAAQVSGLWGQTAHTALEKMSIQWSLTPFVFLIHIIPPLAFKTEYCNDYDCQWVVVFNESETTSLLTTNLQMSQCIIIATDLFPSLLRNALVCVRCTIT